MRGKRNWSLAGCAGSVVVFAVVLRLYSAGMDGFLIRAHAENAKSLQESMLRACVQCYAIEGEYPPGIGYLEKHYGIWIDKERYHVFYDGFASNLMPDIVVIPVMKEHKSFRK